MATAAVHDYDATGAVADGRVNVTRWHLTKASTGTAMGGVIVWYARSLSCCATQAGWPASQVPAVWDTTGTGTVDLASYVQCGGCGSLIYPCALILHGTPDAAAIAATAARLAGEVSRAREAEAAGIRSGLARELRHAAAYADRGALPVLADMTEPGIGIDDGELAAWDYDPRDPSGEAVIEIREGEL